MKSILPNNSSYLQKSLDTVIAKYFEPQTYINDEFIGEKFDDIIGKIWDFENINENLLPWLAWSLGVEIWNDGMTISQKREIIKTYISIRKARGTKFSIVEAFKALGVKATLTENPDPKKPFFFKLVLGDMNSEMRSAVFRMVDLLKPLRTSYIMDIRLPYNYYVSSTVEKETEKEFLTIGKCLAQIEIDRKSVKEPALKLDIFSVPKVATIYVDSFLDEGTVIVKEPNLTFNLERSCVFIDRLAFDIRSRDVLVNGGVYAFNARKSSNVSIKSTGERTQVNNIKIVNTPGLFKTLLGVKTKPNVFQEFDL